MSMNRLKAKALFLLIVTLLCTGVMHTRAAASEDSTSLELVLAGGRVIDPESGLDAIRNVGVKDGIITVISSEPLSGEMVIDVEGLVVAPGFIDLHSHGAFSLANQRYQIHDGVTTSLDLEAGRFRIDSEVKRLDGQALINYGASAGYLNARLLVLDGLVKGSMSGEPGGDFEGFRGILSLVRHKMGGELRATVDKATDSEIEQILELIREEWRSGAMGVGLLLDYMSDGVSTTEVDRLFQVAAQNHQVVFVHQRRSETPGDPSGLFELIEIAEKHGTSMHLCHITSAAINNVDGFLSIIEAARSRGVDITTEAYPYTAGSTIITAQAFQKDWKSAFGIDYEDIEYPATGERLTESSFERLQAEKPNAHIIHHYKKEEWIRLAIASPQVMIASDASYIGSTNVNVHPRSAGSFSRILGHYVREESLLSLPEAVRKMTLMPAQRMESMSEVFRRKGRIQEGMDADIVVFDPENIIDKATYSDSRQYSEGVRYVLVGGKVALEDSSILKGKAYGRWLYAGMHSD